MRKIRVGKDWVESDPETIKLSGLLGKTLARVERGTDEYGDDIIDFVEDSGPTYRLFHEEDCCEGVYIEDIIGELDDLVGSPVTMAEETSNGLLSPKSESDESYTWTFYRLATVKGYVTIRWYGTSNGYYSEDVSFGRVVS